MSCSFITYELVDISFNKISTFKGKIAIFFQYNLYLLYCVCRVCVISAINCFFSVLGNEQPIGTVLNYNSESKGS